MLKLPVNRVIIATLPSCQAGGGFSATREGETPRWPNRRLTDGLHLIIFCAPISTVAIGIARQKTQDTRQQ